MIALNLRYNKNKLYKILDCWSRDILNFNFPEKFLGLASPLDILHDLSRKMFLMLYSIDWQNFIIWLALLLEILSNTYITIVCYLDCDVIKFETNLIFLIKPFCYMTKKSRKKINILRPKRAFEIK